MPRLADRVGRNSLCLHKPGSPFGNGTAYSSIFHVNLQRNRFMIVKRSTGMYADPLFVLHPVRNKRTSRIPGILSFKSFFFPGRIFLSPGKFFNTFPALEKNTKFPRLQCNELRKQFLFRKRLFVKIIPRFALLRFPGRGGQRRAQCHVETDPGKFFPFLHPDTSQYSQRILFPMPWQTPIFQTPPDDPAAISRIPCPSIHEGYKSSPSRPTQRNGPYGKPAPVPGPSTGIPRKTFFPPPVSF